MKSGMSHSFTLHGDSEPLQSSDVSKATSWHRLSVGFVTGAKADKVTLRATVDSPWSPR